MYDIYVCVCVQCRTRKVLLFSVPPLCYCVLQPVSAYAAFITLEYNLLLKTYTNVCTRMCVCVCVVSEDPLFCRTHPFCALVSCRAARHDLGGGFYFNGSHFAYVFLFRLLASNCMYIGFQCVCVCVCVIVFI